MTDHPARRIPDASEHMHPDVAVLYRAIGDQADRITELRADIEQQERGREDSMRRAIISAIREVRDDPETSQRIYTSLMGHARRGLAQSIGEKILGFVASMVVAAACLLYAFGHWRP